MLVLLVALRGQTDISRQQALDAYAAELQAVNFSAVPLWRLLAWFALPRLGWKKGLFLFRCHKVSLRLTLVNGGRPLHPSFTAAALSSWQTKR